jgi:gamma-butyrobetaine dioxygenase
LTISRATINDDQLSVEWTKNNSVTEHFGQFKLSWLQDNTYNNKKQQAVPSEITTTIPFVEYDQVMSCDEGLWTWLYHLNESGTCIINNVPITEEQVIEVGQRISSIQNTIYGKIYDVAVEKNLTNIAYSEMGLELHMDLMYYQSPPGLQLLHCIRNDPCVEGGESTLLDAFGVVQRLREEHPKYFDVLSTIPITFEKVHYERERPVHMTYYKPHIGLDSNGQITSISWSPAQLGTLILKEDEIEDYYEASTYLFDCFNSSPFMMKHRLEPGQLLSYNNHRMLHGRMSYSSNGGQRHFKGVYVNIDEYLSKLQVLSAKLKKQEIIKSVFNGSS